MHQRQSQDNKRLNVAVVYHFLPHYRSGVFTELLANSQHAYTLYADKRSMFHVECWPMEEYARHRVTRCWALGPIVLQLGLIRLAFSREYHCIIYLGSFYFPMTWISALIARALGKRVLFWTHGWIRRERGLKAKLRAAFYRIAHALVLYGHTGRMLCMDQGLSFEQLHVIYNSMDYETQRKVRSRIDARRENDVRRRLFGDDSSPIVICTARLTAACRLELLLEAQHKLRLSGHHIKVVLVGDGPQRPKLEEIARTQRLPVVFYGACYDEQELGELIMAARVTVSPGKVGLTAVHSLAYGTPVITHSDYERQGPEYEAILPGRTGDFFEPDNVSDLARVIEVWTSGPGPDPRVERDCIAVVERFYNPTFQREAIDRAVSGDSVDDLFWMRGQHVNSPS